MIDSARERALRAGSPETTALIDAWDAMIGLRLGDVNRARELLDNAERGVHNDTTFPSDHVRTLTSTVRASLCLDLGDTVGAQKALELAYAAALHTRGRPILALVAVNVAALAVATGGTARPPSARCRLPSARRARPHRLPRPRTHLPGPGRTGRRILCRGIRQRLGVERQDSHDRSRPGEAAPRDQLNPCENASASARRAQMSRPNDYRRRLVNQPHGHTFL
nr:hypothetical protein [uncultured bacterium]